MRTFAELYRSIISRRCLCVLILVALAILTSTLAASRFAFRGDSAYVCNQAMSILDTSSLQQYSHETGGYVPLQHYPPIPALSAAAVYSVTHSWMLSFQLLAVISTVCLVLLVFFAFEYFSRSMGFLVAFFTVFSPYLFSVQRFGFFDTMAGCFFMVTMIGILRGIDDERWLLLSGIGAGMSFLTKSAIGVFMVICGLIGMAWRFYYMRWDILKNKYYLSMIGIFGAITGPWAVRNYIELGVFGNSIGNQKVLALLDGLRGMPLELKIKDNLGRLLEVGP